MESNPENENENQENSGIIHYQKINILGDAGVGKSSLISLMEKYEEENFIIGKQNLNDSEDIMEYSSSLVEQIKRVKIPINDNNNLYFNLYETNLDRYDFIKTNLDTLLFQTECIIIMYDKSNSENFDNIPNLIATINAEIREYKMRNFPIFLIQNKIDLNLNESQINEFDNIKNSIEEIMKENKNVIYKEISLLDKNNFYELILDINRYMDLYKEKQKHMKDAVYLVKLNEKRNQIINKNGNNNIKFLNIILLGYTCVGKTTFFKYFLGERNENYISTIGIDSFKMNAEINKEKITIQLYDTAGQERFNSISKNYLKYADGVLLFFDVTNEESFRTVDKWISDINEIKDKNDIVVILIANKIDVPENEKVIDKKEVKEKANKYNIKYFEVCCLNGLNLYEILNEIALDGYYKFYEKNSKMPSKNNSIQLNHKKVKKKKKKKNECC